MKKNRLCSAIAPLGMLFYPVIGQAADLSFSGYASFVGGIATKQAELPDGSESYYSADPHNANIDGTLSRDASYFDTFTFRPDSNYGLQIDSDLSEGLTASAQITGRGSKDFKAEIEWAYLSYELTNNILLQAGRQRAPIYYYSSFIDVGYAYHWIRPPVEVYNGILDTYEGVSLTINGAMGFVNASLQTYVGNAESIESFYAPIRAEGVFGTSLTLDTDWLRLRASYMGGDTYTEGTSTDRDNSTFAYFTSVSAHVTLGDFFILGEATRAEISDYLDNYNSASQLDLNHSYMVSLGYEFMSFTPHVTVSGSTNRNVEGLYPEQDPRSLLGGAKARQLNGTVGLRWDFHPSSSFKIEFSNRIDRSDDIITELAGKQNEVGVFSAGIDLIF